MYKNTSIRKVVFIQTKIVAVSYDWWCLSAMTTETWFPYWSAVNVNWKSWVLENPLTIVNRVSETFLEREKSICAACRYDLWRFTLKSGRFLCSSECMQLFKGARCQRKVQRHCLSLMKYFDRVKKQQQQHNHHQPHHHNHYHHHHQQQQTTNKQKNSTKSAAN